MAKRETLLSLTVGKHFFRRYPREDKYAEEMVCNTCGLIIPPCFSIDDGKKAVEDLGRDINKCKRW